MQTYARTLGLVVGIITVAVTSRVTSAGCPSSGSPGCDLASGVAIALVPDPLCLTVTGEENDCVCSSTLSIVNDCAFAVEAVGWCNDTTGNDCFQMIAPGATGKIELPRVGSNAPGTNNVELPLRIGTTDVTLTLEYEMLHIEDPVGCSVGSASSRETFGLILLGLGVVVFRRRSRAVTIRR